MMRGQFWHHTGRLVGAAAAFALAVGSSAAAAGSREPTLEPQALNGQLVAGYRVASGDKLRITVFDEPSLSGDYQISTDGDLSLPLLESIRADGHVTSSLAEAIAQRLQAGGYVLVPRVSVEVIEHRPFYILGEVNEPGEYAYSGDLTLSQAVAKAGGFTPRANKKIILLERQRTGQRVRVKLGDAQLLIAPGDTITVREAFF